MMKYVINRVNEILYMIVNVYFIISGIIFEVWGMFFVNINMNIVRFSRIVMIREIFLFDLGGRLNENIVSIVSIIYGKIRLVR